MRNGGTAQLRTRARDRRREAGPSNSWACSLDKAGAGAEIMRPADFVRTEAGDGTNEGVPVIRTKIRRGEARWPLTCRARLSSIDRYRKYPDTPRIQTTRHSGTSISSRSNG